MPLPPALRSNRGAWAIPMADFVRITVEAYCERALGPWPYPGITLQVCFRVLWLLAAMTPFVVHHVILQTGQSIGPNPFYPRPNRLTPCDKRLRSQTPFRYFAHPTYRASRLRPDSVNVTCRNIPNARHDLCAGFEKPGARWRVEIPIDFGEDEWTSYVAAYD